MSVTTQHVFSWRDVSAEEHNEAAGFVLDCILDDGACDDELGNSAALRPTKIARMKDGSIRAVLCNVRPSCAGDLISGLTPAAPEDDRIFMAV